MIPNKKLHYAALAVLVALALLAVTRARLQPLEDRLLDSRFANSRRQIKIDPSLCLILIDDKSFRDITTPTTFWAPYFAKVGASLLDAGAAAVGIDYMPIDIDVGVYQKLGVSFFKGLKTDDLQSNAWLPLFNALQRREPAPYVQGLYPDVDGEQPMGQYRPALELMSILHSSQMAMLNLSRDRDGVLRHQTVLPLQRTQRAWHSNTASYSPLGARLAETATNQTLDIEHPLFNGQPVPLIEGEAIRINYPWRASQIPAYSFSDVLEWGKDPERLKQTFAHKIVLLGPGTKLLKDLVETPIGEIFGVEGHAYTLNTLLTGQFLREVTPTRSWLLALLLVVLAALIGSALPPLAGLLGILTLTFLLEQTVDHLFAQNSLLIPMVWPLLGAWTAWGASSLLRSRAQSLEKRHIRQLFGRYVSSSVMETLLRDPSQAMLGAVGKRRLTVLFSDINGFSTHCEKRTPEQIMTMLNNYFENMNRIIFKNGGTIKQFVGDEIMAMYGAPTPHPQPEIAAVQSAVEMIRCLQALHREDPNEDHGFYLIKVGIHVGDVILGNVGSLERAEYAAVGDDVNLGSRIMGMTKALHADILISKEVYDKVSHLPGMTFTSKGAHLVKGRQTPVEIYQVAPTTEEGS